MTDRQTDTSAC